MYQIEAETSNFTHKIQQLTNKFLKIETTWLILGYIYHKIVSNWESVNKLRNLRTGIAPKKTDIFGFYRWFCKNLKWPPYR